MGGISQERMAQCWVVEILFIQISMDGGISRGIFRNIFSGTADVMMNRDYVLSNEGVIRN